MGNRDDDSDHKEHSHSDEEVDNEEDDKAYDDYVKNVGRAEKQSVIGQELDWRKIKFNNGYDLHDRENNFASNEIHTAKYTVISFLPK